jgi:hypothetical protein
VECLIARFYGYATDAGHIFRYRMDGERGLGILSMLNP